jgi:hypothetical protein
MPLGSTLKNLKKLRRKWRFASVVRATRAYFSVAVMKIPVDVAREFFS